MTDGKDDGGPHICIPQFTDLSAVAVRKF